MKYQDTDAMDRMAAEAGIPPHNEMKSREAFHRDDHLPARRRRRRDCLIVYGLLALAVALWIPLILMVMFGWGAA